MDMLLAAYQSGLDAYPYRSLTRTLSAKRSAALTEARREWSSDQYCTKKKGPSRDISAEMLHPGADVWIT